jgi:hypothetical protein
MRTQNCLFQMHFGAFEESTLYKVPRRTGHAVADVRWPVIAIRDHGFSPQLMGAGTWSRRPDYRVLVRFVRPVWVGHVAVEESLGPVGARPTAAELS